MNNNNAQKLSPEYLQKQQSGARSSLLAVLLFTVINLAMLLLDTGRYFLFSATVPQFLTAFGMGMDMGLGHYGIGPFTGIALAVSAAILVLYLLCWLLSKKRPGWLIAALVFFILDSVVLLVACLLMDSLADSILDLVFHIWVIVQLSIGISAGSKLKKLPPEAPVQTPWEHTGPEF